MKDYYKILVSNKKARYEYKIIGNVEAGIMLNGLEVKSLRNSNCTLVDSYVKIENNEARLYNCDIPSMDKYIKYDSKRVRKLLLHKYEIEKLFSYCIAPGNALIPLNVYIKGNKIKVEIGLCIGKKQYDKRESIKKRDMRRLNYET